MAMPTRFQVVQPPAAVQSTMGGGAHVHTTQSIFHHLMGEANSQNVPGNWEQVPQVPPMYMPWSVPNLQQSQLVRFTGERQQTSPIVTNIHQKRKIDTPEFQPSKQFISEEKMAAHFESMHISASTTNLPVPSTSKASEPQPSMSSDVDLDVDLDVESAPGVLDEGKSMHPRLVISDELKRLQQEPLLPTSLLSKLDRPSMALVLWEPPSRHLRMLSTRQLTSPPTATINTSSAEQDNNNNNNNNNNNSIDNNNEQIPNLNPSIEPMDL